MKVSKLHGDSSFPGDGYCNVERTVTRLSEATKTHLALFNGGLECIRILDASTGRTTMKERKENRARLYPRYLKSAEREGVKPVSERYYYYCWPDDIKDAAKVRECICGTCYYCGQLSFDGYRELCDTLNSTFATVPGIREATERLKMLNDVAQETLDREFYRHNSLHSSTATHCRTNALSAVYGGEQGEDCDAARHLDSDGNPRSDYMEPNDEEAATMDVWDDARCYRCDKAGGGDDPQAKNFNPSKWPMACDHCPHFVHNNKKCLGGEEPINMEKDSFLCEACVVLKMGKLHSMDCSKCNARFHLVADMRRLLTHLAEVGHGDSEQVNRWMKTRAEEYAENLDRFAAHKMQDAHQQQAYNEMRRNLLFYQVLIIWDYASKVMPIRSAMPQSEGFGNLAAISRGSATATFRATAEDNPDLSAEELDETFTVAVLNIVSDNAAQGTVHALQGLNASFKLLHEQFPHLTEVIGWSDGATDYTGAAFVHGLLINNLEATTGVKVISHDHSIPGEGKNVNDIKNGHMGQALKRLRQTGGVGSDQQTAQQVGGAMDFVRLSGVQNLIAEISATTVELVSPAGITNFYSKQRSTDEDEPDAVLMRCFTGIGGGTNMNIKCSDENSETLQRAIANVSVPISLSEDGSTSAGEVQIKPTRKLLKQRKEEAARRKAMAKKATESARLQDPRQMARDELDAKLLAARMAKILQCTTCRWRYTISRRPAYDTHRLTCGARTVNDTMEERISAALGTTGRTEETRCKDCEVYIIEVTSIRELQELNLTRPAGEGEMRIGEEGVTTGNAYVAMLAVAGATLRTVDGDVPEFDPAGKLVITFPAKLVFFSRQLPVLMRGWGRKQPRRSKLTICTEVDDYLHKQWEANKQITAYLLAEKMKVDFAEQLQLNQHDCQRWLLRVYQRVRAVAAERKAVVAETAATDAAERG